MLDDRIIGLARKSIAAQLTDMDEPLATRVNAWKAKLQGNGRLFIYVLQTYEEEVKARAQIIWRNLQRAHSSFGTRLSGTLRNDLFSAFRVEIDAVISALAPRLDNDMTGVPRGFTYQNKFGNARDHEVARHEAEIEHYVTSLETAAARGAEIAGSYNFYGAVGAVMTGPGAIANVTQNIGADQRKAIVEALTLAKTALESAPELHARDKTELLEIADGAASEISRESPNSRRLSQALQNIASTVQGIANGGQAYEAIRAAANAIGIPI